MTQNHQPTFDIHDSAFVDIYDELPLWSAPFGALLLEHVPLPLGGRLLDIGCGTGFPLLELVQRLGPGCEAVGLDPWQDALDRAERKIRLLGLENVRVLAGDAAEMPFDDNAFDLITSNLVVNNVPDPAACLRECHRVAAPGGALALTTNLQGHMAEFYDVYERTLRELGLTDRLDALAEHVAHRTTLAHTTGLLEAAGFACAKVVEGSFSLRFATGTALLEHTFIQQAFLRRWREVAEGVGEDFWPRLEANLNALAAERGEVSLTIPMAYVEARKSADPVLEQSSP